LTIVSCSRETVDIAESEMQGELPKLSTPRVAVYDSGMNRLVSRA